MVAVIIITITIVAIIGITAYFIYRFVIYDFLCKQSVVKTLQKYNIKKTPDQIIKEYHNSKGENISEKEIQSLEKHYRQHEPEQFLAMYDAIRDKSKTNEKD
ncbi:MAG: hypothetical protein ACREAF_02790 [Nitrosopumilaceae archaeon]